MKYWKLFFRVIGMLLSLQLIADEQKRAPVNENKKFILITVLYNEPNEKRIEEYLTCLDINLRHKMIEKVHVIYDTSQDEKTIDTPLLDSLIMRPVSIQYVSDRPTFAFCFSLANKYYPGRRIILSNADIYFNQTLYYLKEYDISNKFVVLTRWEKDEKGYLVPFMFNNEIPNVASQDVWIFETPLQKFWSDDIKIGTYNCEPWIMYYAKKAGLPVVNPCLTIQCCHLHTSTIRHYDYYDLPPDYNPVRWSRLEK